MRKRDLHILTSNIFTYTGDQRFSVIHPQDSDDWDLKIEYAQLRDSGIYECQVNTEPKINLAIHLDITGNSSSYYFFSFSFFFKKILSLSIIKKKSIPSFLIFF